MDKCVHIAPMMGWTDRHGRFLLRRLSRHLRLWTEMIAAPALIYGDRERILSDPQPHEVVLQLGGAAPDELARAARLGEAAGYGEINLNMGCPSCRVGAGGFGAKLMLTPDVAARCVEAVARAVDVPVSVKCRIGVDDQKPENILPDFIRRLSQAGADRFVIHARKAWLRGLSPKQNRSVPPLDYRLVHDLKSEFPRQHLILNGGVESLDAAKQHLADMDGVMIGRAAFRNPFMFADFDRRFFGATAAPVSRAEVLRDFMDYAMRHDLPSFKIIRLASGLWAGQKGAARFRRVLNQTQDPAHLRATADQWDEAA